MSEGTNEGEKQREAIAELIVAGDEREALVALREAVGWPHGKSVPPSELPLWVGLLGTLVRRRDEQLGEVFDAVVRDPDSPDRLYELGYALIDLGAPAIAATVLWRCLALVGDSEEVVCELVSALESALAYPDAYAILHEHAALRDRSFLCRYLYGFNAAMSGDLDLARAVAPTLAPDSPETTAMQTTLVDLVARANLVAPRDARDLRGWHYVLAGGLLAHLSPYGLDEPMHGRYAWLADSLARVATGIAALEPLLAKLAVPCIYTPPGRDNEILAMAISIRTGLSLAPWPAVGVPAPGLVVAYDLATIPAAQAAQLVNRRADQLLFVHATPWTIDCPVAADVTTLLYQILVPPWAETPDSPVAELAAALAASPVLPAEDRADDASGWAALVELVWPFSPGVRSRMWAGGPVSSNRFT
ncbi:MAG TPA: hypothetical protein VGM90_08625 [Kofleriaceae bacterium]